MEQEKEVAVPETVMARCPLVGFKLRQVALCTTCPHFRGLADRFPGHDEKPFAIRYAVLCAGEPTRRELLEVEA